MIAGSLARRYARAVFSIAVEAGRFEALSREISAMAGAISTSSELSSTLTNPIFKRAQRRAVLNNVLARLGTSSTTRNFFNLLLDRERISAAPAIARELANMVDNKLERIKAVVTTATRLSPMQAQQIKQALEQVSGKLVELSQVENADLLGGVVAQLGDIEYDGSLRTQLSLMRDSLTNAPA